MNLRVAITSAITLFLKSPITIILILCSYMGAVLVSLDPDELWFVRWLLFQTVQYGWFAPISDGILQGQFWRIITPVFLHYSLPHVIVSTCFFWLIARPIELFKGSWHFLLLLVVVASITHFVQFLANPNKFFGGLVCVVYGAMGYILAYQYLLNSNNFSRFKPIVVILFIALIMGLIGVFDLFISSGIFHRTILVGLLVGAAYGFAVGLIDKRKLANNS